MYSRPAASFSQDPPDGATIQEVYQINQLTSLWRKARRHLGIWSLSTRLRETNTTFVVLYILIAKIPLYTPTMPLAPLADPWKKLEMKQLAEVRHVTLKSLPKSVVLVESKES